MLLLALLAAGLAAIFVWGFNLPMRWRLRCVPGPSPDWLLGNMREIKDFRYSHELFQQWAQKYGPVFCFWLGRRPCVVISDPDLVQQVGAKRFVSFHDRPKVDLMMGAAPDTLYQNNGILFAEGKYWMGVRTACEPLFHSAALASYAPMMNAAADQLLAKLQAAAGSREAINVSKLLMGMTLDVIGSTVFGVDFHAQKDGADSMMVEAAHAMFRANGGMPVWAACLSYASPRLRALWLHLSVLLRGGTLRNTMAARRYLWGASQALVDGARGQPIEPAGTAAKGGTDGSAKAGAAAPLDESYASIMNAPSESAAFRQAYQAFAGWVPPQSSIVSRLKDAVNKQTGLPLTDRDICSQMYIFLLAGYETTSLALSYTLYELARNPHCQQRIMQEVDAFGRGRPIGYEDLAQFPYTEAAFLEAMRLYPPVSALVALARVPTQEGARVSVSLGQSGTDGASTGKGNGSTTYNIPAGSRLMLNVWSIHHDPKHWPDPWQYRPERFLAGSAEAAARHPCAFFPFGLGPRKCVGYRFALEEGVLCLARLLQRFELRLDQQHHAGPLDLRTAVTVVPQGGIWLRVHSRE